MAYEPVPISDSARKGILRGVAIGALMWAGIVYAALRVAGAL